MKKTMAMLVMAGLCALAGFALYARFSPQSDGEASGRDGVTSSIARPEAGQETSQRTGQTMARGQRGFGQGSGMGPAMQPLVVARPVVKKIMNDQLTAIGSGRAQSTVELTPWSSGVLTALYVKAGDHVEKGGAVARLDSDNEEIALERARVELENARDAHARIIHLRDSDTASRVEVINAELALARAELVLRDATLALERRTIRAPQSGIVGILPVDIGNYVTVSTTIARIDARDKILIDVWVPERFAPSISAGQPIVAEAVARAGLRFSGHVSAIDNAIDETSRTLRVRCEIVNKDDSLRAGMSFRVTLLFPGDSFASVDPLAVQWNGQGAYVWRLEGNKTVFVPVTIIQRNADSVLVRGDLTEGEMVVVQGVQNLRDGAQVTLRHEGESQEDATGSPPPEKDIKEQTTPARLSNRLP